LLPDKRRTIVASKLILDWSPEQISGRLKIRHLGLGRAYVLQGDIPKAKAAYQDFLTLWKDADPDIPVLRKALMLPRVFGLPGTTRAGPIRNNRNFRQAYWPLTDLKQSPENRRHSPLSRIRKGGTALVFTFTTD
jgi:hypothetical protein